MIRDRNSAPFFGYPGFHDVERLVVYRPLIKVLTVPHLVGISDGYYAEGPVGLTKAQYKRGVSMHDPPGEITRGLGCGSAQWIAMMS